MNSLSGLLQTGVKRRKIGINIFLSVFILVFVSACGQKKQNRSETTNQSAVSNQKAEQAVSTDTTVIHLRLKDYAYIPDTLRFPTGKPIKIMMKNTGKVIHEFMAGKDGVRADKHGFRQSLFQGVTVDNQRAWLRRVPVT